MIAVIVEFDVSRIGIKTSLQSLLDLRRRLGSELWRLEAAFDLWAGHLDLRLTKVTTKSRLVQQLRRVCRSHPRETFRHENSVSADVVVSRSPAIRGRRYQICKRVDLP